MKLIVMGHARHGKDTVSELLSEMLNVPWVSSSWFACCAAVYPVLKNHYGYATPQECFSDRGAHRSEWFTLIAMYCAEDRTRLARELFEHHDIYCGIRNKEELTAIRAAGLVNYTIWVDASKRLPPEPLNSCTVTQADADLIIRNNSTKFQLTQTVRTLVNFLPKERKVAA